MVAIVKWYRGIFSFLRGKMCDHITHGMSTIRFDKRNYGNYDTINHSIIVFSLRYLGIWNDDARKLKPNYWFLKWFNNIPLYYALT